MSTLLLALSASILSSLGGLIGGVLLLANAQVAQRTSRYLVSFAAGVLLSVTFLDLLPEAIEGFGDTHRALQYALLGVVLFFLLERAIASFHNHEDAVEHDADHPAPFDLHRARPLVIVGDSVHNFIDGIVVAIAFIASPALGLASAVSVFLHELPHEIADFAILLRSGMPRRRVLLVNLLSALVAPIGTVAAYYSATALTSLQLPLLAVAAGNLLYVAMADLLPHLHHERNVVRVVVQALCFLVGVMVFFFLPGHE